MRQGVWPVRPGFCLTGKTSDMMDEERKPGHSKLKFRVASTEPVKESSLGVGGGKCLRVGKAQGSV